MYIIRQYITSSIGKWPLEWLTENNFTSTVTCQSEYPLVEFCQSFYKDMQKVGLPYLGSFKLTSLQNLKMMVYPMKINYFVICVSVQYRLQKSFWGNTIFKLENITLTNNQIPETIVFNTTKTIK